MRPIDANRLRMRLESYVRDCEQEEDWLPAQVFMDVIAEIQDCPTIDPEDLRPHGRWLDIPNAYVSVASTDGSYHGCATSCSVCGEVNPNAYKTNCCPNCGAKMIEEVLNA